MTNPTPEEIINARIAAKLTQVQAAKLIYCTRNAWQKWEYGERNMPAAEWELFKIKTSQQPAKQK